MLPGLLARIDDLAGLDDRAYFEKEAMSSLALDDAAIHPHQVSAAPHIGIISSIDHLQTVASIVRAGTLPMVALVSLLRSALETACSAIYFLAPDGRRERVLRALRDAYCQIADRENMMSDLAPGEVVNRAAHEDMIRRALAGFPAAGTWQEATGGRPVSITGKIEVACPIVETYSRRSREEFAIRGLWRGFSGMTHGRQYAALAILDREELKYDDGTGTVTAHMTFGASSLVGTLAVVLDVVDTAVKLYGCRARAFLNQPEDIALAEQLRRDGRL